MLSTIYRRTAQGQIAVLTRSTLPVAQARLLMRFTGFTPLEYLCAGLSGPEHACEDAGRLLAAGMIEMVPAAEEPLSSAWGDLDELVPG